VAFCPAVNFSRGILSGGIWAMAFCAVAFCPVALCPGFLYCTAVDVDVLFVLHDNGVPEMPTFVQRRAHQTTLTLQPGVYITTTPGNPVNLLESY